MHKDWLNMSILEIIEEYKEGDNTPLDGDEVYRLTQIIKAKINLQEGNILEEEYEQELNNIYNKEFIQAVKKEKMRSAGMKNHR